MAADPQSRVAYPTPLESPYDRHDVRRAARFQHWHGWFLDPRPDARSRGSQSRPRALSNESGPGLARELELDCWREVAKKAHPLRKTTALSDDEPGGPGTLGGETTLSEESGRSAHGLPVG